MKLISTTEFILNNKETTTFDTAEVDWVYKEIDILRKIRIYANFLNNKLNLGMFVPCDMNGVILKDSECRYDIELCTNSKCVEYKEAKNRVLFEGFTNPRDYNEFFFVLDFVNNDGKETIWFDKRETIEFLLGFDFEFTLTDSVTKHFK